MSGIDGQVVAVNVWDEITTVTDQVIEAFRSRTASWCCVA